MTKYRNSLLDQDLLEDEIDHSDVTNNESNQKEQELPSTNWEKRYSDSRRYITQLQNQIKELEEKTSSVEEEMPSNMDEFEAWKKKYPDFYRMLKMSIAEESKPLKSKVEKEVNSLKQRTDENRRRDAQKELLNRVPNFPDIIRSAEFKEWIAARKGGWEYDALFHNDTDVDLAVDAIKKYQSSVKEDGEEKENKRKQESDLARNVTKSHAEAPFGNQIKWSESKVQSLKDHEYEKYEEEIMTAMRTGKFEYDLTGSAR